MNLRKIVDLIITIWKIIKYIIPIILGIILFISNNYQFLFNKVNFQLEVWKIILIILFAIYPFIKLIERIILGKRKRITNNGLLWDKRILSFLTPKPRCPIEGCGLEVVCIRKNPKSLQFFDSVSSIKNIDNSFHYTYECPIHGRLNVPDESLNILTEKAKSALKRK